MRGESSRDGGEGPARVPAPLLRWIEEVTGELPASGAPRTNLLDAGVAALSGAVERPGRNRETARMLLVADALLTGACRAAAEDPGEDVEGGLLEVLRRVARVAA